MTREFKFKSTVEEIKINNEIYGIDFSDEKIKEYQAKLRQFQADTLEMEKVDVDNLSAEDEEKYLNKSIEMVKGVVDALLGDGTFDKLYQESGKSVMNMIDLVTFLGEIINEKTRQVKQEKTNKYLKNKKR